MTRGTLSGILAAGALAVAGAAYAPRPAAAALPFYRTAELSPEWLTAREAAASSLHHIAPFSFRDQHGNAITEHAFDGRITIVQFFFISCGDICPMTTRNLAGALRALGNDSRIQLLSYSVAGERDSVGALAAYARARGITDARWHLLSGTRGTVAALATKSFFIRIGDGSTYGAASIEHTETVLLIDGRGRIRGVYAGTLGLEMNRLREDVDVLLKAGADPGQRSR